MNWKERVKPSNAAEAGCLVFLAAIPFLGAAIFLGVLDYIPYIAMGSLLIVLAIGMYFHLIRFKQTVYERWLGRQPKEGIIDG